MRKVYMIALMALFLFPLRSNADPMPVDTNGRVPVSQPGDPCTIGTIQSVDVQISAAGAAITIPAPGLGNYIHICRVNLISNGSGTIEIWYGTSTACAIGKTPIDGPDPVTAETGLNNPFAANELFGKIPVNNEVCIDPESSATAYGSISYVVLTY